MYNMHYYFMLYWGSLIVFLRTTPCTIDTAHYTEKASEVVLLWDLFF